MTDLRPAVVPEELTASVQHLELLSEAIASLRSKVARLEAARTETLAQIATASKRVTHEWSQEELLALYDRLNSPGFFTAWKAAGLPNPQRLRSDVETAHRHVPNDLVSGGWLGEWVTEEEIPGPYPRDWTPVVYVLYGSDCEPIYCGSTEHFKTRLKCHDREGKRFVAWRAVRCSSREDAYWLEDQLLKQHCPPLNRRASR